MEAEIGLFRILIALGLLGWLAYVLLANNGVEPFAPDSKTIPISSHAILVHKDGRIEFSNSEGRLILQSVDDFGPVLTGPTDDGACPGRVSLSNRKYFLRQYERYTGISTATHIEQVEKYAEECREGES